MQIFLLFLVSTLSGRATDMGFFHHSIFFGSLLQVLSVFMTSISSEYWQLFLAQGVAMGLGNGLLFCPVLVCYISHSRLLLGAHRTVSK